MNTGQKSGTVDIVNSAERLLRLSNPNLSHRKFVVDIVNSAERLLRLVYLMAQAAADHQVDIVNSAERLLRLVYSVHVIDKADVRVDIVNSAERLLRLADAEAEDAMGHHRRYRQFSRKAFETRKTFYQLRTQRTSVDIVNSAERLLRLDFGVRPVPERGRRYRQFSRKAADGPSATY